MKLPSFCACCCKLSTQHRRFAARVFQLGNRRRIEDSTYFFLFLLPALLSSSQNWFLAVCFLNASHPELSSLDPPGVSVHLHDSVFPLVSLGLAVCEVFMGSPVTVERGLSFPCNYPSHFGAGLCLVLSVLCVVGVCVLNSSRGQQACTEACFVRLGFTYWRNQKVYNLAWVAWSSFSSSWLWIPIGYKPFHGISLGILCRSWLPAHSSCSMNIHWVKLVDKTCFLLIDYESKDWHSSLVV